MLFLTHNMQQVLYSARLLPAVPQPNARSRRGARFLARSSTQDPYSLDPKFSDGDGPGVSSLLERDRK